MGSAGVAEAPEPAEAPAGSSTTDNESGSRSGSTPEWDRGGRVPRGVAARRKRLLMLYPILQPQSRMPISHRIWMTFEMPSFSSAAFWYAQFSLLIITVSTITFCLESELNCKPFSVDTHALVTDDNCLQWEFAWYLAEIIAVACFTVELILRFLTAPSKRIFLRGVMNWVDFVAILPFFLDLILASVPKSDEVGSGEEGSPVDALSVFRVIRLVRVFRVFKMGKSSSGTPQLPGQLCPCRISALAPRSPRMRVRFHGLAAV